MERKVEREQAKMKNNIVEVLMQGELVGRIALSKEGLCVFEYDENWLLNGFSISPYVLPLQKKVFVAERDPFEGNFGVFDDSLPDGWGTLLLDRYLKEQGKDIESLSILERLSFIGSQGRGALEYRPDESFLKTADFKDFDKTSKQCQEILENKNIEQEELKGLLDYAGSSGGARPKIFANFQGKEWLVKFKATSDPADVGKTEYEYSLLAKKCGINMPETRLLNDKYFAVERFDRIENTKTHTISVSALVNASYRLPNLDYLDLLLLTRDLTKDKSQVLQMYRRMVFNILISNKDDHSKNFAFQRINKEWKLSPAYDLLPSAGFNNMHTTSANNKGNPTLSDLLEVAQKSSISKPEAQAIYDEIYSTSKSEKASKKIK